MDQPNQQPKKFNLHKVFAALGMILTILLLIISGIWIYIQTQGGDLYGTDDEEENTVKVSTSSAEPISTETATEAAE